jgi:hypothetical protein
MPHAANTMLAWENPKTASRMIDAQRRVRRFMDGAF